MASSLLGSARKMYTPCSLSSCGKSVKGDQFFALLKVEVDGHNVIQEARGTTGALGQGEWLHVGERIGRLDWFWDNRHGSADVGLGSHLLGKGQELLQGIAGLEEANGGGRTSFLGSAFHGFAALELFSCLTTLALSAVLAGAILVGQAIPETLGDLFSSPPSTGI